MNLKIKFRESFRPLAPSVLKERAGEYFDMPCDSSYMLFTVPVKAGNSALPAVTHVDHSTRPHTVDRDAHPFFYGILEEFRALTGCSAVINTSFNIRGEPIVNTPEDAYRSFMSTPMDYLVMGSYLFDKAKQPDRGPCFANDRAKEGAFGKAWAKGVAGVVPMLILSFFYYIVFGAVGIVLRVLGKDLVGLKIYKNSVSYWGSRQNDNRGENRYRQQF
jgi:hypothetical protein